MVSIDFNAHPDAGEIAAGTQSTRAVYRIVDQIEDGSRDRSIAREHVDKNSFVGDASTRFGSAC